MVWLNWDLNTMHQPKATASRGRKVTDATIFYSYNILFPSNNVLMLDYSENEIVSKVTGNNYIRQNNNYVI